MHRHLWIVLALISAVAGCTNPTSPSTLSVPKPPPPPPPPPPTGVQLAGSVADAAWRPLVGARVEVVAGEGTGLSTVTNTSGQFRLTVPFDDTTQVRATANGHLDSTLPFPPFCAPCNPNRWLYFNLETDAPHPDLAGNYLMTFVAASECPQLPNEARERTYQANLTRSSNHSQYLMTFSGATLLRLSLDYGSVGISGDYVSLGMGDLHGTPGIVEEVAAHTYVGYDGVAEGLVGTTADEIDLPFAGSIMHCVLSAPMPGPSYACTPPLSVSQSQCRSNNHRVVLKRVN